MNAAPAPSCIRCGYDLSGQPSTPSSLTCPECGEQNAARKPPERFMIARAAQCVAMPFLALVLSGHSVITTCIGATVLCVGVYEAIRMMRLARSWELVLCAPFALLPLIGLAIMVIFLFRSLL